MVLFSRRVERGIESREGGLHLHFGQRLVGEFLDPPSIDGERSLDSSRAPAGDFDAELAAIDPRDVQVVEAGAGTKVAIL